MEDKKEIVKLVLDELGSRNLINTTGQTFKNTEVLLYNINKMKESIKDREEEIRDIKKIGLKTKSKSITSFSGQIGSVSKDEEEIIEETIKGLKKEIFKTKLSLDHIMRAISKLSNDKYYDIITYKYIDNMNLEEIVEVYYNKGIKVDKSTISRNKNRLINELRLILFPNEFILELCK